MTISEAISKLDNIIHELPTKGVEFMREKAPSRTGALRESIRGDDFGAYKVWIGTSLPYAKYVQYGRGWVRPVHKKVLRWMDGDDSVFSMYARPVPPNDFLGETAKRIHSWVASQF